MPLPSSFLQLSADTGVKKVAFSGGVCQNITLLNMLYDRLNGDFELYMNQKVPPNDGGLSFGQAAVGLALLAEKHI